MALNMNIVATSGKATVTVDDELSAELLEAYTALKTLPVTRAVSIDFPTREEARLFVRQAQQWSEANGKNFVRKGDPKGAPTQVVFRIYDPTGRTSKGGRPKGGSKAAQGNQKNAA